VVIFWRLFTPAGVGPENPPDLDFPKGALFHPRIAVTRRAMSSN
jgi:hypothetical protein